MAQIDDLIATYLNAVETEGKSVRTIKSYRDSLATFRLVGRRLGFPDAVEDHDVTHVYAFLAELRARRGRSGRATTTPIYQNHHHRTLGAFFSWCRRMGYLDPERTHVFARVPLARIERKAPRPFSEEEIERLLAGCDRSRMIGCRNYALLLFLLDNGVRSQECASVQLDEVDWERRRVLVHGKGAKQRWVGIGERTADALRDYVARFRGEQAGALFLGRHGEGMADGHSFYVLLGRLAKRVWRREGEPAPFPLQLRHLGDRLGCARARRAVAARPLLAADDPTLRAGLRLRTGGRGARGPQPRGTAHFDARRRPCGCERSPTRERRPRLAFLAERSE